MPNPYGYGYDPAAGFSGAGNFYGARGGRRRYPLLDGFAGNYLESLPYQYGGARAGGDQYPPSGADSPYYGGSVRPSQQAYNFMPPAQTTEVPTAPPYPSALDASLYGPLTSTAPGAGAAPGVPTTEADYWIQRWQVEQADREAERQERARQFNLNREDAQQAALVNTFHTLGQPQPFAQTSGRGGPIAQEQQAAIAEKQRGLAQVEAQRAASPSTVPFQVDRSPGQSQGTMLGNAAFGIHTQRDNVRQDTPGRRGSDQIGTLNALADSAAAGGEGAEKWAEFERYVLENSPRASILERGEDAGVNMTPAERAYLLAKRRLRGSGK
jgi:hypothetical protein